jgi:L-ascorbate metabolism protein UlaG (beta-lactamase superfamily)
MIRSSDAPEGPPEARPRTRIPVAFLGHATVLVELGGVRVLTDPFLRSGLGPLQRHGDLPDPAAATADIVVISHGHPDHFDPGSIESLHGNPVVVVPRGLAGQVGGAGVSDVVELEAGRSVAIAGVRISAVPARHWISPGAPRARPIGYVIERDARVYFAGDTGRYPEMRAAVGSVDLALLPVWTWGPHLGPGHLGPLGAAEVARDIGAAAALPIHWATLYPRQLHRVWRRPLHEPGDRFAAHVRRLAPDVDVRVLRPGESTIFGR